MNGHFRSRKYHVSILGMALLVLIAGASYRDQIRKTAAETTAQVEDLNASLMTEVQQLRMAFEKTRTRPIQDVVAQFSEEPIPYLVAISEYEDPAKSVSLVETFRDDRPVSQAHLENLWPGSKSGILIDSKGLILTTADVADTQSEFRVRRQDGTESIADLIAADRAERLALLKLRGTRNETAYPRDLLSAEKPRVGDRLLCVGRSASGQMVSPAVLSLVRSRSGLANWFILDGTIASEQDGGVVFDLQGHIAGVIVSLPGTGAAGSIFVPAERALAIAEELRSRSTSAQLSWIGLSLQELNKGLKDYFHVESGALVTDVVKGGPADRAGIKPSDVITFVNDSSVGSSRLLIPEIQAFAPDSKLTIRLLREGKEKAVELQTISFERRIQDHDPLGIDLGISSVPGIEIKGILQDSEAQLAGLQAGDTILEINGIPIKSRAEFVKARNRAKPTEPQLWRFDRKGVRSYVVVRAVAPPSS